MKYNSWEDMVDAQATAFSALCAQNEELVKLAEKADNGYNNMTTEEQDKLFKLLDETYNNPFFRNRCMKEEEEMEEDPLEYESPVDLFGPWWE